MPNLVTQGQAIFGDAIISDSSATTGAPVARVSRVVMTAATGAKNALSWQNPTGQRIIVLHVAIDITTGSGTATIDVGIGDGTNASHDDLIDGRSTATAAVINSATHNGTNGACSRALPKDLFLTGSITGTIGAFAGVAYITYVPV